MNKEMKRQLILSGVLLCLLISTLLLWYRNFIFHTYINVADYQYCFRGENESLLIDGYEFYENKYGAENGKARIVPLSDMFFQKGDQVDLTFVLTTSQATYEFKQTKKIQSDNEVLYLDEQDTQERLSDQDFAHAQMNVKVMRDNGTVYDESLEMKKQSLVVYNGGNKDYTIQEVYASSSWLKTGLFSSTKKGIDQDYPTMTIDYLYLKDGGQEDNINDYERFAYIKGKTKDILNGSLQEVAYYDEQGSLLDKNLCCVITLIQENEQDVYTFMIDLHGTIKAVETHE